MKKRGCVKAATRGICRQGDVLLVPVEAVPTEDIEPAPKTDGRGLLLAIGESSGHSHRVFGRGSKLFHFSDTNRSARMLVVGLDGAEVRVVGGEVGGVPRHTPIALAPGAWEVRTQREYTVEDERRSRAVAD